MEITGIKDTLTAKIDMLVGIWEGSVIDIETTGLNPASDEIVTLGFIEDNKLQIIQRTSKDKAEYYKELKEVVTNLKAPFYAYNGSFEKRFLHAQLGIEKDFVDVFLPWRIMAESKGQKWPKLDDLVSEPEMYLGIPRITGRECPILWKNFLKTKDQALLTPIMDHNKSDILRTLFLLIQYPELYTKN
jgi:uncharacterized protein YprB with RNaseH-like and TPR domain|tara:strand:+ start:279 stop:842 length:564 start_codon:yes stop_codon:yes gene_type:complete